jgi:hypothetical protein
MLEHIKDTPHLKQISLEYRTENIYYLRRLLTAVKQNKSIDNIRLIDLTMLSSDLILQSLVNSLRLNSNIKHLHFTTSLIYTQTDKYVTKLADMIKDNKQLETLDLTLDQSNYCTNTGVYDEERGWIIHPVLYEAKRYLIDVLKVHPNINTLVIGRFLWIETIAQMMHELLDNPKLKDLSYNFKVNHDDSIIVKFLDKLVFNTTLERIYIQSLNYSTMLTSSRFYDAISELFCHNKTLKSFTLGSISFYNIPFDPFVSWGTSIAQNITLHELVLTDVILSNEQLIDLIQGINQNTTLQILTLYPMFETHEHRTLFSESQVLLTNTSIWTLKTNLWPIEPLITYINTNTNLTELIVSCRSILPRDSIVQIPLLFTTGNLKKLNINSVHNYSRVHRFMLDIPDATLQNINELEELLLCGDKLYNIEPYLERNRIRNMSLFNRLLIATNFMEPPGKLKRTRSSSRVTAKRACKH